MPSNLSPLHLKETSPPMIRYFTEDERDLESHRVVSFRKSVGNWSKTAGNTTKNWQVTLHFSGTGAGDKGDPGPQGPKGEKGESAPLPSGPISK